MWRLRGAYAGSSMLFPYRRCGGRVKSPGRLHGLADCWLLWKRSSSAGFLFACPCRRGGSVATRRAVCLSGMAQPLPAAARLGHLQLSLNRSISGQTTAQPTRGRLRRRGYALTESDQSPRGMDFESPLRRPRRSGSRARHQTHHLYTLADAPNNGNSAPASLLTPLGSSMSSGRHRLRQSKNRSA